MNTFEDMFEKVGIDRKDIDLKIAYAKYLNSGGTIERARALLDEIAAGMPGEDRAVGAANCGLHNSAPSRQPVEDGGAERNVPRGHSSIALPSSPSRGGEGQKHGAKEGQLAGALPVREPKPIRAPVNLGGQHSIALKTDLANTVLDRVKTSDGRAWGDVGAHELDGMDRDGALARAVKAHLGVLLNKQRFMKVRDLVSPATFEKIRSETNGA